MKIPIKTVSRRRALELSIIVPAMSIVSAVAITLAIVAEATSSSGAAAKVPPPTEPACCPSIPEGRARFVQSCAHCHGDDARGSGEDGDGPDLHGLPLSNARIAKIIRGGIRGEMPAFAKKYSASDTADLVAYLRSLR